MGAARVVFIYWYGLSVVEVDYIWRMCLACGWSESHYLQPCWVTYPAHSNTKLSRQKHMFAMHHHPVNCLTWTEKWMSSSNIKIWLECWECTENTDVWTKLFLIIYSVEYNCSNLPPEKYSDIHCLYMYRKYKICHYTCKHGKSWFITLTLVKSKSIGHTNGKLLPWRQYVVTVWVVCLEHNPLHWHYPTILESHCDMLVCSVGYHAKGAVDNGVCQVVGYHHWGIQLEVEDGWGWKLPQQTRVPCKRVLWTNPSNISCALVPLSGAPCKGQLSHAVFSILTE